MKKGLYSLFLLVLFFFMSLGGAFSGSVLKWESWSDSLFDKAKRENRFVLLDLEAVWCHWCHVMEQTTYQDSQVKALLQSRFIPVKVDQDSRPDLANRYLAYGWPATVVFAPDGTEIVKRRGYIEPEAMKRLLEAILKDPSPEDPEEVPISSAPPAPVLSFSLRQDLMKRHRDSYDSEQGGLQHNQKFLDRDSVEYALFLANRGDALENARARQTLRAAEGLIDPVWGGVYQYSTHGDWDHPHYEKLTQRQGEYLRIYALAYGLFRDPRDLKAAQDIHRYLEVFQKSGDGVFYTSQDADLRPGQKAHDYFALGDRERRLQGIPRVDRNIYARENGTVIKSLTVLSTVTGEDRYLTQAKEAARWVLNHRSISRGLVDRAKWWLKQRSSPAGGFYHGEKDTAGPYLGDNLAMADAFLHLYVAGAERHWLKEAKATADFIARNFKSEAGFQTAKSGSSGARVPVIRDLTENLQAARFFNLLFHYSGDSRYQSLARHAMSYLSIPSVSDETLTEPGILLADEELIQDPAHLTVVGSKSDPSARLLFQEALRLPLAYKRIEWWDPKEGPMPHADVQYPKLPKAAAFVCIAKTCSPPVYRTEDVLKTAARLQGRNPA